MISENSEERDEPENEKTLRIAGLSVERAREDSNL
jgi:hypothetical protein